MKSKALPKRIRVMGQYFFIDPVPGLSESEEALALVEVNKRRIKFDPDVDNEVMKEALFHEVIHIGERILAVEENYLTEEQVMMVAGIVFAILRDNPTFSQWILEEE